MVRTYKRTGRAIAWRARVHWPEGSTFIDFHQDQGAYQHARRMFRNYPEVERIELSKLHRDADDWTPVRTMTRESL